MTDLGRFLDVDLGSSLQTLLFGEAHLVQCLKDIKNWKVKEEFFSFHPQFKIDYQRYHPGYW
jgi:hypothetical protein